MEKSRPPLSIPRATPVPSVTAPVLLFVHEFTCTELESVTAPPDFTALTPAVKELATTVYSLEFSRRRPFVAS